MRRRRLVTAPTVSGFGAPANIVRAGFGDVVAAANAMLGAATGSGPGAGAGSSGPPSGGTYPGTVTSWLQQAMKLAGVSGPLWLAMLQRQVMRESSGNPLAINLTDSNAAAGHPSKGLLQTIDSTFSKYALPGHGEHLEPGRQRDRRDPLHDRQLRRRQRGRGGAGDVEPRRRRLRGRRLGRRRRGRDHDHQHLQPALDVDRRHEAAEEGADQAPATPKVHVPKTVRDALKRLLPYDVTYDDTVAGKYSSQQVDLSTADQQLTYTQGLAPYPAQPLVTLTDADVAAFGPVRDARVSDRRPARQPVRMVVGRFFGPSGIQGGTWVPGISQRESQITAQLTNLYAQQTSLTQSGSFYNKAIAAELAAKAQRAKRRARVLAFLRKQVIKAKAIQAELAAITTGNLQKNLATALSRAGITRRLAGLRADRTSVAASSPPRSSHSPSCRRSSATRRTPPRSRPSSARSTSRSASRPRSSRRVPAPPRSARRTRRS